MEEMPTETLRVSGAVEAIAQHEKNRHSIKVGGEWYSGFGACPVEKGKVYVIDYVMRGEFRNLRRMREVSDELDEITDGETTDEAGDVTAREANHVRFESWKQGTMTAADEQTIQAEIRSRNMRIAAESIRDAKHLLEQEFRSPMPHNVLELAIYLSERRTPHVSKSYDEFLRAKVAAESSRARVDRKSDHTEKRSSMQEAV